MKNKIYLLPALFLINLSFSQVNKIQIQTQNYGLKNTVNPLQNNKDLNHTESDDELEVFNLVTPNGDGDNDVFVIRNIELYPDNSVEIYNRWGVKVFGVRGYGQDQNYFRGVSEGRATINQDAELPVGTYWYIIKYKNAQGNWKQRVGYLYLNK